MSDRIYHLHASNMNGMCHLTLFRGDDIAGEGSGFSFSDALRSLANDIELRERT